MGTEIPKVSDRSTKSVILAAHKKALVKLAAVEKNPRLALQQGKDQDAIKRVGQVSVEDVVKDLSSTKLLVSSTLSDLESKLIEKKSQLGDIQQAISAEESNLKDVHGITREADSFAALVQAQKDERFVFTAAMDETRAAWAKESQKHSASVTDRNQAADEEFRRRSEQFKYEQNKKELETKDSFSVTSKTRLRELADKEEVIVRGLKERENDLKSKESDFASLQDQVANFPSILEAKVAAAAEEAKTRASKSYGFESRALKKDAEASAALAGQTISSLELQVASLTKDNLSLRSGIEKSQTEVKEVAVQAIKGAQQINNYGSPETTGKK